MRLKFSHHSVFTAAHLFNFQHQTMNNGMTRNETNDMALSEWFLYRIDGFLPLPVKERIMECYGLKEQSDNLETTPIHFLIET